ncbi:hypothetical protein RS1P1_35880, partial [Pseudomonas moraviensis]
MAPSVCDR